MRRILLIAAMLLPVASAMAVTSISAVDEGEVVYDGVKHHTIRIDYVTDTDIRAFALSISVDNGTNIGDNAPTDFLAGESIDPNKGYGIFPSRFRDFIDPGDPDWDDANYMPITAWDEPGAENTGLGWPSMVVELGTLYSGDGNKPDSAGTLFKFDVNSEGASDCNLVIAVENTYRGGVVDNNADEVDPCFPTNPLYIVFASPPPPPPFITYPTASINGRYTVSWGASTGATYYVLEKSFGGGAYAQVYSGPDLSILADALEGTNQYQVKAGNGDGESTYTTGAVSTTAYCYTVAEADQSEWLLLGRPKGWCFPRQCHGDADGYSEGKSSYWASTLDLGVLKAAWNKQAAEIYVAPDPNGSADFNHAFEGKSSYRASTLDLGILKTNWNHQNLPLPDCSPGTAGPTDD